MNINYINESVISVAVMRGKHTHTHTHIYVDAHTPTHTHTGPIGTGQCVEDVCCVSTTVAAKGE